MSCENAFMGAAVRLAERNVRRQRRFRGQDKQKGRISAPSPSHLPPLTRGEGQAQSNQNQSNQPPESSSSALCSSFAGSAFGVGWAGSTRWITGSGWLL